MSTNAVAFLLLNVYREGGMLLEIAADLDKLREELKHSGKDTGFTGESVDVVEHAVSTLLPYFIFT
jgi:glycerol-3-phosphate O-acyltransferase 1/2